MWDSGSMKVPRYSALLSHKLEWKLFIQIILWWWFSCSCPALLQPHGLWPSRLLCPWDCPGQNTGVGCHFLLEGIILAQGSNPSLLHCRWILYWLSHQGSPCFGRLFLPNDVLLSTYYVPGSAPQAGIGYTQLFVCLFVCLFVFPPETLNLVEGGKKASKHFI